MGDDRITVLLVADILSRPGSSGVSWTDPRLIRSLLDRSPAPLFSVESLDTLAEGMRNENRPLKELVADLSLDKKILQEAIQKE